MSRGIRPLLPLVAAAVLAAAAVPAHAAVDFRRLNAPTPTASQTPQPSPSVSLPATASTPRKPAYQAGQAIVRFKAGASASSRRVAHARVGASVVRRLLLPDTYLVAFDGSRNPRAVAAVYEHNPNISYAEPNFIRVFDSTMPNDPALGELWGLHNRGQAVNGTPGTDDADIDAPEAWDQTTGRPSVTVGVVDSGIDYDHSDLASNIWTNADETPSNSIDDDSNGVVDDYRGYDFLDDDSDAMDLQGHGTHVAGIIGARGDNGVGVSGVAWDVRLAPLRVCDSGGCDDAAIADAFYYAGVMGMEIVNASLSGPSDPVNPGPYYGQTVANAIGSSANTLFVVAAGNGGADEVGDDNETTPQFPCNYTPSNVVCVAASDVNDRLASFSNRGATSVDLAAPGQYVLSTWRRASGQDQYGYLSGTSQSTPYVAGAAALVLARSPDDTTAQLRSALLGNVDADPELTGKVVTGGRLNADAALPAPPAPPAGHGGDVDMSFGVNGVAFGYHYGTTTGRAVALQPDGKIVVVGTSVPAGSADAEVIRWLPNGNADFLNNVDFGSSSDAGEAVGLQSDGKIIVAGTSNGRFAVARLNTDGSLDTTFGTGGVTIVNFGGTPDQAHAVAVQPDDKIVLAGSTRQVAEVDFALARLDANGSLDTSFSGDGKQTTDISGGSADEAKAVAIQPDGKIVAVGGINFSFAVSPQDFAAVRYNANGTLDTGFGGSGRVTRDFGGTPGTNPPEEANAVAIQPDGKIVAAGQVPGPSGQAYTSYAVWRLDSNGQSDSTFANSGIQFAGLFNPDAQGRGVVVQPSGKIVVAGAAKPNGSSSNIGFALLRFTADGGLDRTFGDPIDGTAFPDICFGPDRAYGIVQQPDGKLVVAGDAEGCPVAESMGVTRLYGNDLGITVDPNVELNPQGQTVSVTGFGWKPGDTVKLYQCRNGVGGGCSNTTTVGVDSQGGFSASKAVAYNSIGGGCPDPQGCFIQAEADSNPVSVVAQAPISFKGLASVTATPSAGSIARGESITVGQTINLTAQVKDSSTGGAPTGTVNFYSCGPISFPIACATGGTPLPGNPASLNAPLVQNGSFERPSAGPSFVTYSMGQTFASWTVLNNSVDQDGGGWQDADGSQSIDLNGFDPGWLYQAVPTVSGQRYRLSFAMAGNPGCGGIKKMRVRFGNGPVVDEPTFDTTGHTLASMGWEYHSYEVEASDTTSTIQFIALAPLGNCGPALDDVRLVPLTAGAGDGSASSATSGSVSFSQPGRYCFRAEYSGDSFYSDATDSSRETCIAVKAAAAPGPTAVDDFYLTDAINVLDAPPSGVLQNDVAGAGETAQLTVAPTQGVLVGGLDTDGSFTYDPNPGASGTDSFTYTVTDSTGTSQPATVTIDLSASSALVGTRYHGTKYHGTKYHGTKYHGTKYHGTKYHTLADASMATYAQCGSRWVWVNPQITLYEETYIEVTAALYDGFGTRVASMEGFLADGVFYADLSEPLDLSWPVWQTPVAAGGAYITVVLHAEPADPTRGTYELRNTVGCQT